jgi:hypothetical protein
MKSRLFMGETLCAPAKQAAACLWRQVPPTCMMDPSHPNTSPTVQATTRTDSGYIICCLACLRQAHHCSIEIHPECVAWNHERTLLLWPSTPSDPKSCQLSAFRWCESSQTSSGGENLQSLRESKVGQLVCSKFCTWIELVLNQVSEQGPRVGKRCVVKKAS